MEQTFLQKESNRCEQLKADFLELCEAYGFKGKASKAADLKLYAPTIDIFKQKWIEYKYETDTLILEGDTDGLRINLNETRPDLSNDDMLAFAAKLSELFRCNLRVEDIVGPKDWQKICDHTNYRRRSIEGLDLLRNQSQTIPATKPLKEKKTEER